MPEILNDKPHCFYFVLKNNLLAYVWLEKYLIFFVLVLVVFPFRFLFSFFFWVGLGVGKVKDKEKREGKKKKIKESHLIHFSIGN